LIDLQIKDQSNDIFLLQKITCTI